MYTQSCCSCTVAQLVVSPGSVTISLTKPTRLHARGVVDGVSKQTVAGHLQSDDACAHGTYIAIMLVNTLLNDNMNLL